MITNDEMIMILSSARVRSNKAAVSKAPMKLSVEQAQALGSSKRNLLRFVKVAIQAISDKLEIQRITLKDTQSTDIVNQWLYDDNHFDKLQKNVYKAVVRDGITYVLVAFDSENNAPVLTQVDSYDGNTGAFSIKDSTTNTLLYTVNVWNAGIQRNVDIYYPERIEKYYYDTDMDMWRNRYDYDGEAWPIDWTNDNGEALGIALVSFDIDESDITEAVQLQQDLNEAYLDMLATSKTMGWPQRVLKNASKETYLLNQYNEPLMFGSTSYPIPRKIELTPGSILMLQGADSDLVQLPPAEINTAAIDKIEQFMTQVTTVPNHYFGGSEWPSGVALINSEMRLNHKVESHQSYLTPSMLQVIKLMLRLSNTFGDTTLDIESMIDVVWYAPQVEDEDLRIQKAESNTKNVALLKAQGLISIETAVRTLYPLWDETQIQNEVARIKAEQSIVSL